MLADNKWYCFICAAFGSFVVISLSLLYFMLNMFKSVLSIYNVVG